MFGKVQIPIKLFSMVGSFYIIQYPLGGAAIIVGYDRSAFVQSSPWLVATANQFSTEQLSGV